MHWRAKVGNAETSVAVDAPEIASRCAFICGHGAGGNMQDRALLAAAGEFVRRGLSVVRFNFLYTERRSGRPDPMPQLKDCYRAVADDVRQRFNPQTLIVGGRSMGGRVASMLAADGFDCAGLLLLAYPLHPPKRLDQLRDAHLPQIRVPVLCFNGTRDEMCTPELMQRVLERVNTRWEMHWLDGADHSFHVLKRSGRTDADVLKEVGEASEQWVASLMASRSA
jgi:predicted alpha/beta-hydrolase family hydrolase